MQVVSTIKNLREITKKARRAGQTIGLVPTMGFLHDGHISLMRRARQENDVVVVSIFVNPTQFGPSEDLDAYPRNAVRDKALMVEEAVDVVFMPNVEQLYPDEFTTFVEVEGPMAQVLCGQSRPTHFRGVTTIVAKLFHLVAPDRAYFGQKDAQQVAVIQQMVRDLDFDLQVVICPTVRETDGLAMSSRNTYLSPRQRAEAVVLSKSLFEAREVIAGGERRAGAVAQGIKVRISEVPDAVIDYIAVVDARTLADLDTLTGEVLIAVAARFGGTRLIDNIRVAVSIHEGCSITGR